MGATKYEPVVSVNVQLPTNDRLLKDFLLVFVFLSFLFYSSDSIYSRLYTVHVFLSVDSCVPGSGDDGILHFQLNT